MVRGLCEVLFYWVHYLPISGPLYSTVHPAWCLWMASVCLALDEESEAKWQVLIAMMDQIGGDYKNVSLMYNCNLGRDTLPPAIL